MLHPTPIRSLAALSIIALCCASQAQPQAAHVPASQLPATSPTTQSQVPSQPPQSQPVPATHRAEVSYTNSQLSVAADNSSLNQILRDVSRQTGMKITGGVSDEHVFGKYGPAPPSIVLALLLQGTGSNMLLVQNGTAAPIELILTPRTGGVTPPNPNAASANDAADNDDTPPASTERFINRAPRQNGELDPHRPDPPPTLLPPNNPPTTPPDTTQEQSPNGVKTPQQIYDQLMRLRQQTQQPAAPQ